MPRLKSPALPAALALVRGGASIRAAAQSVGIAPSTLSRAIKERQRPTCPCCGQVIASPRTASTEE